MKLSSHKYALGISFALALAGCGGSGFSEPATPSSVAPPVVDGPPFLGEPYTIAGKRYEPRDDNAFDQVGYARVFGESKRGAPTPNGEQVNPDLIEIAHQTLPIPSYVELTHLETGRTILARVSNRGPMATSAIVELSPAAARDLGMDGQSAPIRVRRVNPPVPERAALRNGRAAGPRLDTPPALLSALRRKMKDEGVQVDRGAAEAAATMPSSPQRTVATRPPAAQPSGRRGADFGGPINPRLAPPDVELETTEPAMTARPKPASIRPAMRESWFVQLAAFGRQDAAENLASQAGAKAFREAGGIWRVRAGPYPNESAARNAADEWKGRGYPNARADFGAVAANSAPSVAPQASLPPAVSAGWHVQLAAFGSRDRALAFARKAGVSNIVEAGGVWRVRAGPYAGEAEARAAVEQWQEKGFDGATVSR